jgi:hypothetical protein
MIHGKALQFVEEKNENEGSVKSTVPVPASP